MTIDGAIKELKTIYLGDSIKMREAKNMAIEALEELQAHREAWENVITGINDTLETLSDGGDDWFTAEKLNDVLDIIAEYRPEEGDAE